VVQKQVFPLLFLVFFTPLWGQSIWRPALETSWQWQLTGRIDLSLDVEMFDLDLFLTDAATIRDLHNRGKKVVCYVSVGTFEPFRPDAARFPDSVKGRPLEDFPDERWLDIRQIDLLRPILEARFDQCRDKGFDGIEPDNVDGYINRTGFPLTAADQLRFNRFIADMAHARGLSVGLKNDLDQVNELLPHFDWALNEQCFQYNECHLLRPFIQAGKAVFHVEYERQPSQFCPQTNALNFNSLRKNYELDAFRQACRDVPPFRVTNAASYSTAGLAPGQIVTVFGADMGPTAGAGLALVNGAVNTVLGGTRLLFNGLAAPMIFANSTQATAIVPYAVAGRATVVVEVERNGARRPGLTFPVVASQPGIFTLNASGAGQAAALNQDGSLNTPERPAARGSVLVLFATGEGATNPDGVEARVNRAPNLPQPRLPVRVRIGGVEATPDYAGAAPDSVSGLLQVNVRIPPTAPSGSAVPVTLLIGEALSRTGTTVAIQ
jgi:uncharacterized protein (TIGR03437 family)